MSSVDEILASGRYKDRRGRRFGRITSPSKSRGEWLQWWPEIHPYPDEILSPKEMRLLIERDMHRNECPGLNLCALHPVPRVLIRYRWSKDAYFIAVSSGHRSGGTHDTLAEAMDGGYELAVQS